MKPAKDGVPETQKPCARWRDAEEGSASGDPAMVFVFRMASILPVSNGRLARYVQRPDCCWSVLHSPQGRLDDLVQHVRLCLSCTIRNPRATTGHLAGSCKKRAPESARLLRTKAQRRMLCFSSSAL